MTNDRWDKALAQLFSSKEYSGLKQLLEYCRPEQKEKTLIVRTPGTFYHAMLAKPDGIAILKEAFGVDGVTFEQDLALKKEYLDNLAQRPPAQAEPKTGLDERLEKAIDGRVMTYARAEKIIANILTCFDNADHLSKDTHPDKNKYLVTEANGLAYRTIKRLLGTFPDSPGERPVMINGGIALGKTHLLQSCAWALVEKIRQARDLLPARKIEEGRKLLELGDVPPETVLRKLEKTAKMRIRYIRGEDFYTEHILCTNKGAWVGREGNQEEYRRQRDTLYDTIDILFFDDMHALARGEKTSTLEYAYKVVDRLYNEGKAVISVVDTPPKVLVDNIKNEDVRRNVSRLFTRCYEGGIIEIQNPAKEDLVDVVNQYLRTMSPESVAVTIDSMKQGTFFSVAKNYRDALSVARTAYKFTLEGLSQEQAIKKGISSLKETRAVEGDLFTQ